MKEYTATPNKLGSCENSAFTGVTECPLAMRIIDITIIDMNEVHLRADSRVSKLITKWSKFSRI